MALKLPFITRPPKRSVYHDWSLFNLNNLSEPREPDAQKENIDSLLSAANNSSQHVDDLYEDNLPARRFAHCFLSLKDKINKLDQPVCPSVFEISKSDIKKLQRMSSAKKPKNNIPATFECGLDVFG